MHPKKKKRYFYYRCTKETHHGRTACKMKQVSAQELDDVVLQWLRELSTDEALVKGVVDSTDAGGEDKTAVMEQEKARTVRLLNDLNKQVDTLIDQLAKGFSGSRAVQERLRKMEAQQKVYQEEIDDIDFKIRRMERERLDAEVLLSSLRSLSYLVGQATPQQLQAVIPIVVDSIVVSPDGIKIRLKEQLGVGPKEKASTKVNPEGNSALADIVWLPVLRTQRNIASGWHIVPVFCNSHDRNVIYTIAPPNKPEKAMPVSPVALALAFQQMLEDGEVNNRSDLARKVGLTRARVTQILNLLKLPDSVIRNLCSVSEPKSLVFFSERRLRSITRLPKAKEQIKAFHDLEKRAAGIAAP
jgi:hypothetical protein